MTQPRDPLDTLREPVVPVEPDAAFAARLRARLASALLNPKGANMTSDIQAEPVTVPEGAPSEGDVVYAALWSPDAARAQTFYTSVLGWRVEWIDPVSRRILDVTPRMNMRTEAGDGTLFLCHAVDDVRAAVERARAAGGRIDDPREEPFGLVADGTDNQGMRLALLEMPRTGRAPIPPAGAGELLYLTVEVPDSQAFRDFYGAVFGWTFTPGRVEDGWGITGITPMTGMRGGAARPTVVPMYGVPDIGAAVTAVRAGGGTATEPERQPYGTTADCVDDQGVRFYLGQV
jgi:predicted enzyme related to lactoylglutathione lyase